MFVFFFSGRFVGGCQYTIFCVVAGLVIWFEKNSNRCSLGCSSWSIKSSEVEFNDNKSYSRSYWWLGKPHWTSIRISTSISMIQSLSHFVLMKVLISVNVFVRLQRFDHFIYSFSHAHAVMLFKRLQYSYYGSRDNYFIDLYFIWFSRWKCNCFHNIEKLHLQVPAQNRTEEKRE